MTKSSRQILLQLVALLLLFVCAPLGGAARGTAAAQATAGDEVVHFAIIGDMGTGSRRQRETAAAMVKVREERFPFSFVITVGDNIYGGEDPSDMQRKFVVPYKALLDAGVIFYASLGNHDDPSQRLYEPFNMNGERYYTFTKGPAQFFALDSTLMTPEQVQWFENELRQSTAPWKIAYMHHPLYSSGLRHGPLLTLRNAIEPILVKYGVQVVFAGHEHFYERYAPQQNVQHFITGAAGQLRLKNIRFTKETAAGYDTDNSFMLARIRGDEMYFESVSRRGWVIDSGVVDQRGGTRAVSPTPGPQQ